MTVTLNDIQANFHSIKISDGTNTLAIDSNGNVGVTDAGGSLTVDATDFDIRDLSANTDSVKIGDGTDFLAINADGSINVQGSLSTVPGGFDTWKVTSQSVSNTATQLAATPLSGRIYLEIQNLGAVDVYVNFSNAVTASNGLKIAKGSSWSIDLDDNAAIYAITASGTADLRIAEYAY